MRIAGLLGQSTSTASIEAFVEHLGGNMALLGLGSLSLERWGKALVFVLDDSPLGAPGDPLLAAVVEGALQRALGRDVQVVVLGRDDARVRLFVASAKGAQRANELLGQGVKWADALQRLHEGGSA
jgi:hypothetical protein